MKKQVPQVSFKTVVGDLISFHSFGSDMNLFGSDIIFPILISQIHNLLVLLVTVLINGVKKQVSQVSYKTVAGDLI